MDAKDIGEIASWLMQAGLKGMAETDILAGFCEQCRQHGLNLDRAMALMDTLHPVYEGRAFRWDGNRVIEREFEYGPSHQGIAAENWQRSAFYHMLTTGGDEVRRRIGFGEPADFYGLDTLQADGHTDYIAMVHRFEEGGTIGEMDCFYSNFATAAEVGFPDEDLYVLRKLTPALALAIKCTGMSRIARTIAEVYLGEDAARHVLEGKITRGKTERISAALWFSDLANYTRISDTAEPDEIIPMLNAYADAVISSIHEAGGNVLKLIGDGTLAIFKARNSADACAAALMAESLLRQRLRDLNAQRQIEGRPVTDVYLGLHIGDVFYGNIGSMDRLDFTVIGPAVNEVSRIASMCRSADRNVLMSSNFVEALSTHNSNDLVSVGRYALRGVNRPQELFTLLSSAA
ncbi:MULTISPECIES: adenylate/guanylate cyclase domain-containing protein [Rhizobium]|jgi:adenylate cyclase|uniref:Adenylate cyclase n=1 Tax=Rhizobium lusitanum TaxID=293958 RepID=A0A1C3UR37_9HYPH|nr:MULTISPECIES: adenylate/guanylate cyclase domain-containing protein [Rhizobium]NRP86590.1 Adenylate cyclase 1 [Ensifer adhaerens]NKJ03536.1 adenylate cyclase [Rhizobium sp. SG741]NKJ33671.1 adenylate cyclase [Rhizobium sp. SG570]NTJ08089.1 adenylate/guanylate cyclase domain-containing protein [Rhizobium lusitanum]SCB17911.1 adenylate cyclase [Rhizobium lusitanum]